MSLNLRIGSSRVLDMGGARSAGQLRADLSAEVSRATAAEAAKLDKTSVASTADMDAATSVTKWANPAGVKRYVDARIVAIAASSDPAIAAEASLRSATDADLYASKLSSFSTMSAFTAASNIAGGLIMVRGYAVEGDSEPATYIRLGGAPGTIKPWHVQDADGAWWQLASRILQFGFCGAKGDGSNMDTIPVRNTFSYAKWRAGNFGGAAICNPPGQWKIDAYLLDFSGVTDGGNGPAAVSVKGAGPASSVFVLASDYTAQPLFRLTGDLSAYAAPHVSWWEFEGFGLEGQGKAADVFEFTCSDRITLRDLQGYNIWGTCLRGREYWDSDIQNVRWVTCGDDGAKWGGAVRPVEDFGWYRPGNSLTGCNHLRRRGVQIEDHRYTGTYCGPGTEDLSLEGKWHGAVAGDGTPASSVNHVVMDGTKNVNIEPGSFLGVTNGYDVVIQTSSYPYGSFGNTVESCTLGSGVHVIGDVWATRIRNNRLGGNAPGGLDILVEGGRGHDIANNRRSDGSPAKVVRSSSSYNPQPQTFLDPVSAPTVQRSRLPVQSLIDLDFERSVFARSGVESDLAYMPGYAFSGGTGSAESVIDATGLLTSAASGAPALSNKGLALFATRKNLLTSPLAPATETQSLSAGTYTLTVAGPGSATLSGGPSGTATAGNPVTFTLGSTTSVTVTKSGTLTAFQVATLSIDSPIVETYNTNRTTPMLAISMPTLPSVFSFAVKWRKDASISGGYPLLLSMDDGSQNNCIQLYYTNSSGRLALAVSSGGSGLLDLTLGTPSFGEHVIAGRIGVGDVSVTIDGAAVVTSGLSAIPTMTTFRPGQRPDASSPLNGYIERAALLGGLSDSHLGAIAASL